MACPDQCQLTIVIVVLLVLSVSSIGYRTFGGALGALLLALTIGCASAGDESSQLVAAAPTAVSTTAPLSMPAATPQVAATPMPAATPLPVTPTPAPTEVEPTPIPTATSLPVTPTPAPTEVEPTPVDSTPVATATVQAVEPTATPMPLPSATPEPQAPAELADAEPTADSEPDATSMSVTPTAVVLASGEPPLECFDRDVQVYRAHVDGVDDLSFEGGRVYCSGAATNAVSAAASYRHASGLVVSRNADFIFNEAGTAYIPYSGTMYFCQNGQPQSAPFRAQTVPALLVVIDNEAQRLVAEGASAPATFTASGTQC